MHHIIDKFIMVIYQKIAINLIDLQIKTTVILSVVFTLRCRIKYIIPLLQNMVKNIPSRILIRYSDKVKVYSYSNIER